MGGGGDVTGGCGEREVEKGLSRAQFHCQGFVGRRGVGKGEQGYLAAIRVGGKQTLSGFYHPVPFLTFS